MRAPISVLATVLLASGAAHAATTLVEPDARISDEAIHADQQAIAALEGRIQALNDAGRPLGDYAMAKAQCWLNTAFHEYSRNDRSEWPEAALQESMRLVSSLEAGQEPAGETPMVAGAKRLREDLWARAAEHKNHERISLPLVILPHDHLCYTLRKQPVRQLIVCPRFFLRMHYSIGAIDETRFHSHHRPVLH